MRAQWNNNKVIKNKKVKLAKDNSSKVDQRSVIAYEAKKTNSKSEQN